MSVAQTGMDLAHRKLEGCIALVQVHMQAELRVAMNCKTALLVATNRKNTALAVQAGVHTHQGHTDRKLVAGRIAVEKDTAAALAAGSIVVRVAGNCLPHNPEANTNED